jgi:hypothetical protein
MTKADNPSGKDASRAAREKRLAEALRANLRRRKTGTRPQAEGADSGHQEPEKSKESTEKSG